jgi:5-formyltetrahydrofolate cyclo-ligase
VNSAQLKRAKRAIRRAVLAERDAMPAAVRREAGVRVTTRFLELPEVRGARTVMLFWSLGSEVDTGPLIERLHGAGVTVTLPRITDGELVPIRYAPGDPTTPTSFGAREPLGDAVDRRDLDVVGVPGIAFDRHGRRIGYGGGYYDRFLGDLPAFTAGIAFAVQLLDRDLPAGRFDRSIDAIVTEDETVRTPT